MFEEKTMDEKPLPNCLPGSVCAQYVKRNDRVYGPYWYRMWREKGRLRKEYVPVRSLEVVRAACETHRLQRKGRADANKRLKELQCMRRELARQTNLLIEGIHVRELLARTSYEALTRRQKERVDRFAAKAGIPQP